MLKLTRIFVCFSFVALCILTLHLRPAFAKRQDTIKIAYYSAGAPHSWLDDSNKMQGTLVDLLAEVFKRLDTKTVNKGFPWLRAQRMVEKGQMDAFCTIATPSRMKYASFCKTPVLHEHVFITTAKNNPARDEILSISKFSELEKYRIVNYRGGNLSLDHKHLNITDVDNSQLAMMGLVNSNYDLFLGMSLLVKYYARCTNVADRLVYGPFDGLPAGSPKEAFQLGISHKSPWINRMDEIEKAIQEIHADGTYDAIFEKYEKVKDENCK